MGGFYIVVEKIIFTQADIVLGQTKGLADFYSNIDQISIDAVTGQNTTPQALKNVSAPARNAPLFSVSN